MFLIYLISQIGFRSFHKATASFFPPHLSLFKWILNLTILIYLWLALTYKVKEVKWVQACVYTQDPFEETETDWQSAQGIKKKEKKD